MKVSYNTKMKSILTWWNEETNTGTPDAMCPGDEGIKEMYDLPDFETPDELDYPLTAYIFIDGKFTLDEKRIQTSQEKCYVEPTVEYAISKAIENINEAAERVRGKYINMGTGQALSYMIKENEANAYVEAGRPKDTSEYLMLKAEAAERNITVSALADSIIESIAKWKSIAIEIETIRIRYKTLVLSLNDKTTSIDEVYAIEEEAARILREI